MTSLALFTLTLASLAPTQTSEPDPIAAYGRTVTQLHRPVAVAFGPSEEGGEERLWIAEAGDAGRGPRVSALPRDASGPSEPLLVIGDGTLVEPSALAVRGGHVYVCDTGRRELLALPIAGKRTRVLLSEDPARGGLVHPVHLSVTPKGELIVCDDAAGQVLSVDPGTGAFRRLPLGDTRAPRAVCRLFLDGTDHLSVFDSARQELRLLDAAGALVGRPVRHGGFPGQVAGVVALVPTRAGNVHACDAENHRVQLLDPRARTRPCLHRFGLHAIEPGEGEGALHYPTDLAISDTGDLAALAEPLDQRVQVFVRSASEDPRAALRESSGRPAAHLGEVLAARGTYLVTTAPESHTLVVHDLRGETPVEIARVAHFGERLGALSGIAGVGLSGRGRTLLVTDRGNRRLSRAVLAVRPQEPIRAEPELAGFTDGVDLGVLGAGHPELPHRVWPGDVATFTGADGEELIAAADRANDAVLILDQDLALRRVATAPGVAGIGGLCATPGSGFAAVFREGGVARFGADGSFAGTFGDDVLVAPHSVHAVGDELWITDTGSHRIERFAPTESGAESLGAIGTRGLGPLEFLRPAGLTCLADGRVVVVDFGNHRGQILGEDGSFLAGFGPRLYTRPLRRKGGRR